MRKTFERSARRTHVFGSTASPCHRLSGETHVRERDVRSSTPKFRRRDVVHRLMAHMQDAHDTAHNREEHSIRSVAKLPKLVRHPPMLAGKAMPTGHAGERRNRIGQFIQPPLRRGGRPDGDALVRRVGLGDRTRRNLNSKTHADFRLRSFLSASTAGTPRPCSNSCMLRCTASTTSACSKASMILR